MQKNDKRRPAAAEKHGRSEPDRSHDARTDGQADAECSDR